MASGDFLAWIPKDAFFTTGTQDPAEGKSGDTPVWKFDDSTIENLHSWPIMPNYYANGGVTSTYIWSGDGVTTGDVRWQGAMARMEDDADDLDSLTQGTVKAMTVATADVDGELSYDDLLFADPSETAGVAAGEMFRWFVQRNGSIGSDTMVGDAELAACLLKET